MNKNEFQCASCKEIYIKDWSDEEAWEEANDLWSENALKKTEIICTDCFNKMFKNMAHV